MKIIGIACINFNRAIGLNNKLLYRIPPDMSFFKNKTCSTIVSNKKNAVLMGKNTFLSIPNKFKPLSNRIKDILKDKVKDVNISNRLMDSPSCIVIDQNDPSIQMQEIMKRMGNMNATPEVKPILEINPNHKIISKMDKMNKTKKFKDACYLLFDQALLIEGINLSNPSEFVSRLNVALEKSL